MLVTLSVSKIGNKHIWASTSIINIGITVCFDTVDPESPKNMWCNFIMWSFHIFWICCICHESKSMAFRISRFTLKTVILLYDQAGFFLALDLFAKKIKNRPESLRFKAIIEKMHMPSHDKSIFHMQFGEFKVPYKRFVSMKSPKIGRCSNLAFSNLSLHSRVIRKLCPIKIFLYFKIAI